MSKFAASTDVPVEKSKAEIEATVRRYGADGFMSAWADDRATIQFRCQNRHVRFTMDLPKRTEKRFTEYKRSDFGPTHTREPVAAAKLWEQACRQKRRALALLVKAKLEAIDSNIGTFESEFLANIVLPDNSTVYERTKDHIAIAYESGRMPNLLSDLRGKA